jgi:hypothetical protein
MPLPVDNAEYHLQVLSDVRLLGSRTRKSTSQSATATRTPLADRVRLFARERENVAREGFDALVHQAFPRHARPRQARFPGLRSEAARIQAR